MNVEFSCIIIDDEQDAVELLSARINLLFTNIRIAGCHTKWNTALEALRTEPPDIVFIDILMPGKSGLDLLRLLPSLPSEIIFTTSHSSYALETFQFAPTGYLLKPIDDMELMASTNKAMERATLKRVLNQPANNDVQMVGNRIGIFNNKGVDYFSFEDIIYLEANDRYTNVVTKSSKLLSAFTLGSFVPILNQDMFYKIHRSYIVNINCILRYNTSGILTMCNKDELPVARKDREQFLKFLAKLGTVYLGNDKHNGKRSNNSDCTEW